MAHRVFLPDGTRPTEEYAEELQGKGEAYSMLKGTRPILSFGILDRGSSKGEAWAFVTDEARSHALSMTRGACRLLPVVATRMNLKILYAKVRKEEPRWNWWIQSIRMRDSTGTMKSFEIADILKQDEREYVLYVMNF